MTAYMLPIYQSPSEMGSSLKKKKKKKKYSQGEQIFFSLRVDPFKKGAKPIFKELFP